MIEDEKEGKVMELTKQVRVGEKYQQVLQG